MSATAYGLGCDAPGPLTKAGTVPVAGHTIAADPRVLPLGSIVHIGGLGRRQVHDVGGGIKGLELDLFMNDCDEARAWGRRNVSVYVLHVPQKRTPHERRLAAGMDPLGARVTDRQRPTPSSTDSAKAKRAGIESGPGVSRESYARTKLIAAALLLGASVVFLSAAILFALSVKAPR
jgi:3D (Asp-Asp-Asp) domain-containing protein